MSVLLIAGSRGYAQRGAVESYVASLPLVVTVLTGGARGVDTWAAAAAQAAGMEVEVLRADWRRYGKRAGILRNAEMVARADQVVVFWDGVSVGTADTIARARRRGTLLGVFDAAGIYRSELRQAPQHGPVTRAGGPYPHRYDASGRCRVCKRDASQLAGLGCPPPA